LSLIALLAVTPGLLCAGSAQRSGAAVLVPPEYSTLPPPVAGGTYVDPVFETTIKRLTDSTASARIVPEYSQSSSFNLDDTYIVLRHGEGGGYHLYDANGKHLRGLPLPREPRWSRINPHWLYGHNGRQIRRLDVSTGQSVNIGPSFPDGISFGNGQGDLSDDDRIAIVRGERYVSIFDLANSTQLAEVDVAGLNSGFDYATVAKDGTSFIIGFFTPGSGRGRGVEQFSADGNFMAQLTNGQSPHGAMGRDLNGSPVFFFTNSSTSPQQPPGCDSGIVKVTLDGAARRACLLELPWGMGRHMSGHGSDGWVYVSTYQPGARPEPAAASDLNATDDDNWHVYTNEILRIRADGSLVQRLAHHRSRANSYWLEPHANISISGRMLVYGSDFQQQEHNGYADTYLLDLALITPSDTLVTLGPSGAITTRFPTYSWLRAAGAQRYELWVSGPLGTLHQRTYAPGSICLGGICSVASPPVAELSLGAHMFAVTAVNATGEATTSAPVAFSVDFRNFRIQQGGGLGR